MGNCLVPELEKSSDDSLKQDHNRWKEKFYQNIKLMQSNNNQESTNQSSKKKNIFKILILGTGESGKSTLVKQMKIIHNQGYTTDETLEFKPIILDNLVSSMKYAVTGMKLLNLNFQLLTNKELAKEMVLCDKYFDDNGVLYPRLEFLLKRLWQDNGVKEAVARGFEYELNDSALYFFENIDRIIKKNYLPNTTDILKSRIRTIGVVETEFKIENQIIRMYDVGGQRSERRKWIQCFDDVKALLFVVAISEYDMTLIEDCDRNRLQESLHLFENISNNIFFYNTITILFMNKIDLFRDKILFTDRQLRYFIPEYNGPDYDAEKASNFIEQHFRKIAYLVNSNKTLFTHFTTATDTENIKNVFQSVCDIILNDGLKQSTLL